MCMSFKNNIEVEVAGVITSFAKVLLRSISLLNRGSFSYSKPYEGNSKYMGVKEKVRWGYKYVVRQIEHAEKGKNIEEYFANQELDFLPDDDFREMSSISVTAGGDLMASKDINPRNTNHLWEDIRDFYFDADIITANLETPFAISKDSGNIPKGAFISAPKLNGTEEMFDRFVEGGKGINFFSTANNHCLDQGEDGLLETLDFIDRKGCMHVGTSRTKQEQMDIPVIHKNGIHVGILSYTFGVNGSDIPVGKEYMANYIRLNMPGTDLSLIEEHIRIAKKKKADIIIACLHWSLEFESYPIQNVIDMGHRILACGVDIIIGNHPHVMQPVEKYKYLDKYSNQQKEGFIAYALGDLVSIHKNLKNSRLGYLVKLRISKGMQSGRQCTRISDMKIKPIYLYSRFVQKQCVDFRLLDFVKLMEQRRSGTSEQRLEDKEIKELERLEKLLCKLLPREASCL